MCIYNGNNGIYCSNTWSLFFEHPEDGALRHPLHRGSRIASAAAPAALKELLRKTCSGCSNNMLWMFEKHVRAI